MNIDSIDALLLNLLQQDAGVSNQDLAARAGLSPATCLRRVKRLTDGGLLARRVALLDVDQLAQVQGHGLQAVVEVTLDHQADERLQGFEDRVLQEAAVQQCYRVSPGPDFILVVHVPDMPAYHAFSQRVLTQDANVRNVKTFFCVKRAKFTTAVVVVPSAASIVI